MATKLSPRPVRRETVKDYRVLYASPDKARPIVIELKTIAGEDMLIFRAKGCRGTWELPVDSAFRSAVTRKAFQEQMRKGKEKAEKKRINARSR